MVPKVSVRVRVNCNWFKIYFEYRVRVSVHADISVISESF